jgi:hypothetical protein
MIGICNDDVERVIRFLTTEMVAIDEMERIW